MKIIALLCLASLSFGCAHITGERTATDGSRLRVDTWRALWSSEQVNFSVKDDKGFTVTLRVEKSSPDAQALGAIAEGVARGMKP